MAEDTWFYFVKLGVIAETKRSKLELHNKRTNRKQPLCHVMLSNPATTHFPFEYTLLAFVWLGATFAQFLESSPEQLHKATLDVELRADQEIS